MKKPASVPSNVAHTVLVGSRHYAVLRFEKLQPATIYTYAITAAEDAAKMQSSSEIRRSKTAVQFDLSYCSYGRTPTFRTLPKPDKEKLRFAFGSCRNFAGGYDGKTDPDLLALYSDYLMKHLRERITSWPHVILLIGDQIYADNVHAAGIRAMEKAIAKRPKLTNLVAVDIKQLDDFIAQKVVSSRYASAFHCVWFNDYATLYEESWTDPDIRVLFANVPIFMLPDDHELTDDFNITGSWIKQALLDPDWRGALVAGLSAYWVYQGWGNVDRATARQHPVLSILETEHDKDATKQLEDVVLKQLRRTLHVPVYFTIPTSPPIIMADARADRAFVAPTTDKAATGDASVIVHSHRDDQIMSDTQFDWLSGELQKSEMPIIATSVPLLQPPLIDRLLTRVRPSAAMDNTRGSQLNADNFEYVLRDIDADTWFAYPSSVSRVLRLLARQKEVLWLAGDVHFSYLFDVPGFKYRDEKSNVVQTKTRFTQVVSSGFQKQISDALAENVFEYGGIEHRDPKTSDPTLQVGLPPPDEVRVSFGLPLDIWPANNKTRFPDQRYGTNNTIAVVDLGGKLRYRFWGANPGAKLEDDPIVVIAVKQV